MKLSNIIAPVPAVILLSILAFVAWVLSHWIGVGVWIIFGGLLFVMLLNGLIAAAVDDGDSGASPSDKLKAPKSDADDHSRNA